MCTYTWGFPGSSAGKELAYEAGDPGLIPGLGRSAGEGIVHILVHVFICMYTLSPCYLQVLHPGIQIYSGNIQEKNSRVSQKAKLEFDLH